MTRARRTNAEINALQSLIYDVASEEQPLTVRGCFYRVMSQGGVPKTEVGYRAVQREVLKMRRAHLIPYHWFQDGSRWRFAPTLTTRYLRRSMKPHGST